MSKNTSITLEDREARLAVLRQMLEVGEQSGVADYSYENLIAELDPLEQ